jgi:hypothetical protein
MQRRRAATLGMACYYTATGVWPLVHIESFEAVTGPKTDRWLVRTVGALALANGIALAIGARLREPSIETQALALLSSAAFATVDVTYVGAGRIRPVYLADAVAEIAFAVALLV